MICGKMAGVGDGHVISASLTRTQLSCFSLLHGREHESKWAAVRGIEEEGEAWEWIKKGYIGNKMIKIHYMHYKKSILLHTINVPI